jgi:primosomal protein N' (replication factor Y)
MDTLHKQQEKTVLQNASILRVAVLTPIRILFDYLAPQTPNLVLCPGLRVKVPFGTQEKIGIIVDIVKHSDYPIEKLKSILEVLEEEPLFPKALFECILWAAQYYHCAIGEMLKTAIPEWLRKGKKLDICLNPPTKQETDIHKAHHLNTAQQQAVTSISEAFYTFKTFLLEGITGSGKTEVYIHLITEALKVSKQVLILVPEIGLTPQMIKRLKSRFNVPIASLHSHLSEKQRYHAWYLAKKGIAPIVVGTRSAVFVPLHNPGLFILDEEHDLSFKQQEGLRYSARDLLILRAQKENCPVVLGTATPSLETHHNASIGRYQKITLPLRAGNAQPPHIQLLDIRHKKLEEGLSAQLLATIRQHLEKKGQVLLFLNRRGFAPVFMCFDCGWTQQCTHCDSKMTFHKRYHRLTCHHCLMNHPAPQQCPQCTTQNLHPIGIGTERLEQALQIHFPTQRILRIDKDTTTQKGTLVGILDIDGALFSVDFRSLERMGQLLTQVAGRAGRAERLGTVLIQTCHPEHPLINLLLEKGYPAFATELLKERQKAKLPPYSHQILIRADAKKK